MAAAFAMQQRLESQLCCISHNVAKQLTEVAAIDTFFDEVPEVLRGEAFLAASDAHLNSQFSLAVDWNHLRSKHCPGHGSFAFTVVV